MLIGEYLYCQVYLTAFVLDCWIYYRMVSQPTIKTKRILLSSQSCDSFSLSHARPYLGRGMDLPRDFGPSRNDVTKFQMKTFLVRFLKFYCAEQLRTFGY